MKWINRVSYIDIYLKDTTDFIAEKRMKPLRFHPWKFYSIIWLARS
ncbi:hypothetical protein BSG1_17945, partial [Bacillus sp. SG-1]